MKVEGRMDTGKESLAIESGCLSAKQTAQPMTAQIIYQGDLRTRATHLASGQTIITDAPVDNQGKGEAFSPTDLVATALGACMLTIMGIRARDHGIDIAGTRCDVTKIMASNPRRIGKVVLTITMPELDYTPTQQQLLEDAARGCPVCRSIHPDTEVELQFVWQQQVATH